MAKKRVEEFMRLKSSIQEERGGGEQAGAEDSPEVWRALYSMLMMVSPWPLSNLALSSVTCFAFYLDMNLCSARNFDIRFSITELTYTSHPGAKSFKAPGVDSETPALKYKEQKEFEKKVFY